MNKNYISLISTGTTLFLAVYICLKKLKKRESISNQENNQNIE